NISVILTGISVADDSGTSDIKVTLSVTSGTLTVRTTGVSGGVSAAQVSNNGSNSVLITAPLAAINATLADASGLQFDPATGFTGSVTLPMATDDQGNTGTGGNLTDTDNRTITVRPPNQAPQGADKTVTTTEDTSYTFSASDFGFSDPDGNNFLAVKIA